jgi:hypothetical protein
MKINATIRSHGDSFLVLKLTASLINPRQRSHLLHYITLRFSFADSAPLREMFQPKKLVHAKTPRRKDAQSQTKTPPERGYLSALSAQREDKVAAFILRRFAIVI